MKRIVRSKSGSEIYGPKFRNMESRWENENGETLHTPKVPNGAAQPAAETNVVGSKSATQAWEGTSTPRIPLSDSHESMYRATLEGDRVGAEMLLEEHPTLATDEITEEGDRALHVAAAMNHQELVREFVERMNPSDLVLLDGHGYTACCYAAILGIVEIADLMIRKNRTLAYARDRENKTPLYKAVLRRNVKMVLYLLKSTKVEDLSMEEWFDILLICIRGQMYGAALEICGINEQLATMRNDEGTALHVLATQRFYSNRMLWITGVMHPDFRLLATKLWECIQRLGKTNVVEILKNPPILHYAARMGNVELITMITQMYPNLVWHTNKEGYTIFHMAVIYRKGTLFDLINQIGAKKDLIVASQDENGNNILHLAAKLWTPAEWKSPITTVRVRQEMLWFEEVKLIVPRFCVEMKNKDGQTPRELFKKEHKSLLEKNTTWMMNTADSWMLISTLIFSVVFASAFAVPGGYNQETGVPILSKSKWFTCFIIFNALAVFFSALAVIRFSGIMMMATESGSKRQPLSIRKGLFFLSLSVFSAISVFASAYFLIYVEDMAALAMPVITIVYTVLISLLLLHSYTFGFKLSRFHLFAPPNRHSLFKRQGHGYKGRWLGQTTRHNVICCV